jgi:hypothetical protein
MISWVYGDSLTDRIVLSAAFLASVGMLAMETWAGFAFDASALDFLAGAVYTTSLCGMDHQR